MTENCEQSLPRKRGRPRNARLDWITQQFPEARSRRAARDKSYMINVARTAAADPVTKRWWDTRMDTHRCLTALYELGHHPPVFIAEVLPRIIDHLDAGGSTKDAVHLIREEALRRALAWIIHHPDEP